VQIALTSLTASQAQKVWENRISYSQEEVLGLRLRHGRHREDAPLQVADQEGPAAGREKGLISSGSKVLLFYPIGHFID
jgi:hypothetical protein